MRTVSLPRIWTPSPISPRAGKSACTRSSKAYTPEAILLFYVNHLRWELLGADRCVPPRLTERRMSWFAACIDDCLNHDSIRKEPAAKIPRGYRCAVEVLSLYADPIWPEPAGNALVSAPGCGVFMQPALVLGHYTHRVSWNFQELPSRQLRKVPDMNHCDFHYSHLLPKKPGILPLEETMTKKCRRCAAEFVTRSRIRKRCDACQTVVSAEKQKKANERLKARRAARRMCLLKAAS